MTPETKTAHTRERLAVIYDALPKVACRGLCVEACGPIACTSGEALRMEFAGGKPLAFDAETLTCGYLRAGRCTVYAVRPFVCRAFGAVEGMRCPFGCEPDRHIDRDEETRLFRQLEATGELVIAKAEGR